MSVIIITSILLSDRAFMGSSLQKQAGMNKTDEDINERADNLYRWLKKEAATFYYLFPKAIIKHS